MTLKTRDIERSLLKKGFIKHNSDHKRFIFINDNIDEGISTKMSHSHSEIGDDLISKMSKQLFMSKDFFKEFVDCKKSESDYIEKLKHISIINKESKKEKKKTIKLEIKYSKHIDLLFHVLAYLKVNNASDCYSEEYIDKISKLKSKSEYDIIPDINLLGEYYNDNFDRLSMINFLPFYSNNFDELKDIFLSYQRFMPDDIKYFIEPFIKILDNEKDFYFKYWDGLHENKKSSRQFIEQNLQNELEKYSCVFDYFNKSAQVFLSYSITRNGRGFGLIASYFSALVPYPENKESIKGVFFQLFHEYTHQFTDDLLKTNINMRDGSHNLSEFVVILADYYLIKAIDKNAVSEYFEWLKPKDNSQNTEITEDLFLSVFSVDDKINDELKVLINKITNVG